MVVRVMAVKLEGRVPLESVEHKVHQVLLDPRETRYFVHISPDITYRMLHLSTNTKK
jgi:hypothetical protein